MVIGYVREQILPQLVDSENRSDRLAEAVHGLPGEQPAKLRTRVARLLDWGEKSQTLAPIVLNMLAG